MSSTKNNQETIREAVGIFHEADHLKAALNELQAAGYKQEELGLLASEHAVQQALGDTYIRANQSNDSRNAPEMAFVHKESVGEAGESMGGGLFFAGTSATMGAVVASSAVLGGALFAAIGGIAAVGAVGALVASVIHQSDADYLQEQVDEGHLLLFVRIRDKAGEQQAREILARHADAEVKMHEVKAKPDA